MEKIYTVRGGSLMGSWRALDAMMAESNATPGLDGTVEQLCGIVRQLSHLGQQITLELNAQLAAEEAERIKPTEIVPPK